MSDPRVKLTFTILGHLLTAVNHWAGAFAFVTNELFDSLPEGEGKRKLEVLRSGSQKKLQNALAKNIPDALDWSNAWNIAIQFIEKFPLEYAEWLECTSGTEAAEKVLARTKDALVKKLRDNPEDIPKVEQLITICYQELYQERDHLRGIEERLALFFAENYDFIKKQFAKFSDDFPENFLKAQEFLERNKALSYIVIPQREYQPKDHPPSELLRADLTDAVPFHGRDKETDDITKWSYSQEAVAIRCYAAQGGMGKTRLFIEMCKNRAEAMWRSGFLSEEDLLKIEDKAWKYIFDSGRDMFLVLDYAERHPQEEFAKFLRELDEATNNGTPKHKIRIVLLTRDISSDIAQSEWWRELKTAHRNIAPILHMVEFYNLSAVVNGVENNEPNLSRRESFVHAVDTFSKILEKTYDPQRIDTVDFSLDYLDRMLYLQAHALAFVEGENLVDEKQILDYILIREERFINKKLSQHNFKLSSIGIAEILTFFADGDNIYDRNDAISRLKRLYGDWKTKDIGHVVDTLHIIYGGKQWIELAMPDILIEEWRSKLGVS